MDDKPVRAGEGSPASGADEKRAPVSLLVFFSLLSLLLCAAGLALLCLYVHPADTIRRETEKNRVDLSVKMELFANRTASEALQNLTYIRKIYALDEDALRGETPDPDGYGSSADPDEVLAVIALAEELLDGQDTAWQPDLPFREGTETSWYLDDTILVLVWQEYVSGVTYYCSEVKIAHPSQFIRLLAGNEFGASRQYPCSVMAAEANAVLASNADFYLFRAIGINVYRGTLYRCSGGLENCFVDAKGDLLVTRRDELTQEEEAQRYIDEHDVRFSLSFGPILVENGVPIQSCRYPVGEIDKAAARSAIGQLGELHYILMNVNYTDIVTTAAAMARKNAVTAYALDGGQTAETVFGGRVFNQIVYDSERSVSDVICFVSAYPAKEAES